MAEALRAGEIESVLVLGDSISDGNGDGTTYSDQNERAALGGRVILESDDGIYCEKPQDQQGWVKYFRNYLLENTAVTVVHNNAIGGMSAKWFNAHKEAVVPQNYDAIVVMLGTNDRWDCSGPKEFYVEYASLLSYLESRCKYLQILTPIPAFDSADPFNTAEFHMDTRQVADVVLELCADRGYACANLYSGLLWYAWTAGVPLDEFYVGATHPSSAGYLHVWRLIAGELDLNLEIGDMYDASFVCEIADIGGERAEITEDTGLFDTFQGENIFPLGISQYFQYSVPFASNERCGGTVITYRYDNSGRQIYKPQWENYDLIRFAGENGRWGPWYYTNRDRFAPELVS